MNVPIYDGNPMFISGDHHTPFGFYDDETEFTGDAIKVTKFCAARLGYPLVDIELQSGSFFAAFEEAVTTYGNELYAYKIRDNQLSLEGTTTGSNINNAIITPTFEPIVRMTKQYGTEAGTGGNIDYYSGSIALTSSLQDYDLQAWATANNITSSIEIKRVFYEPSPAITRYYDPYVGSGFGSKNMFDSFGFGSMSPAINFLMMPINFDLQVIQAIELKDQVRRSQYSFEIKNNKIRLFPIPGSGSARLNFEYIITEERRNSAYASTNNDQVANVSMTPYKNPSYSGINSVGRQWIFEYTLAISKEMLGYVRGKYSNIPIPNAEVTLNQSDLITAATAEKTALIERLRTYFDETSRKSLLERRAQETEFKQAELKQVPYTIYIG